MKKVIMPLPDQDYDPSEAAITWKMLSNNGIEVSFATENGTLPKADPLMLTGIKLGLLKPVLMANADAILAHKEMLASTAFKNPLKWAEIKAESYDGIALAGGHAQGMKQYLESTILQNLVSDFFSQNKIVGAICHGVVLTARSKSKTDPSKSCLFGYKTTSLLKSQELLAWGLTTLWLGNYYRTYPETVEDEVKRNLASSSDFQQGPLAATRDSLNNLGAGYVCVDRNYISARWPGDAHVFGLKIAERLK